MHLKMSSAKWRPSCLGFNVINNWLVPQMAKPLSERIMLQLTYTCINQKSVVSKFAQSYQLSLCCHRYWCSTVIYQPFTCDTFQRELNMLKHIPTYYVIPPLWHHTGSWNPSSSETRTCLCYIVNIMDADVLATQEARASATMILTLPTELIRSQYVKGFDKQSAAVSNYSPSRYK